MILQITVEITAVEFRRLNSFEWAVLNLLNTFPTNAPTIADATAQLSIGEPAFLVAALENLRSAKAIQAKTDEPRRLDLNDYEMSEAGTTILREDGWESEYEETLTEDISLDWPSLRFVSHRNSGNHGERKQAAPPLEEVQEKLTSEKLETWLNQNEDSRCCRVKSFFVTNVES